MTNKGFEMMRHLDHPNVKAFLDLIGNCEGTDIAQKLYNIDPYWVTVGYKKLKHLNDHPGDTNFANNSDASGRYQIMYDTWIEHKKKLGLKDFSPKSQDIFAVYLIAEGQANAIDDLKAGRFYDALHKCARVWASLPVTKATTRPVRNKLGIIIKRIPIAVGESYYKPQKAKLTIQKCAEFFKLYGGSGFFFSSPDKLNPRTQPSGLPGQSWLSWLFGG